MSENNAPVDDDMVEVDLDHPWHQAALAMEPQPAPSSVQLVPVEVPGPGGKKVQAAMLTTVSVNGAFTIFMSPNALMAMVENASELFKYWEGRNQSGLIVADKNMETQARRVADAQAAADKIIRGK